MKSSNLEIRHQPLTWATRLVSRWRAALFFIVLTLLINASAVSQEIRLKLPSAPRSDSTTIQFGLTTISHVFPIDWPRLHGSRMLFQQTPFSDWVRAWELSLQQRLDRERMAAFTRGWTGAPITTAEAPSDLAVDVVRPATDTANKPAGILTGKIGEYADIGMVVQGSGELGGAWTRFEPCDPAMQLTCKPSLFPQLKPDLNFGIRVNGTISERVHVNVDYDQTREFDAANRINVFYKGFEDEVLQLLEVGDVSIRLPASRYLTQGIPAGNFGFKTSGQLGPLEFQAVFAQQRGDVTTREFKLGGLGAGQKLEQEASLVIDDADYVEGQFFFLVEPARLRGAPHIDALGLRASDVDASLRPSREGEIQVYRDERPALNNVQQQAQLGYFLAQGVAAGSAPHSGLFRRLVKDEHYVVHSSGLWIMLRSPLRADEALAISYITESGDTIGTFNAEQAPPGSAPPLKLLRGPVSRHQPGSPTWDYEMHQVYRLDSSNGVDVSTVQLKVSLGELAGGRTFKNVDATPVSLLRLFGLDEDAPVDQIDQAQIYQPGRDAFGGMGGVMQPARSSVTGTFIIFPTMRPFQRPAPVPSARLFTEADVLRVLANDANDVIYDNPDPVVRDGAGKFRLNFTYRLNVEGAVANFNLGAFGIRKDSERIYMGERQLTAGVDYTIDYDLGAVSLNDAPALFAQNPGGQIRATWEQQPLFQIAPTSVFGLNARYGLGRRGELNFVGLYQAEKTIMSRPQLGLEPGSIMLSGMSGRLDLGGYMLDRALARVPGLRLGAPSAVTITGEVALSVPNPNTRDAAYLDDFEATEELFLPTSRRRWFLGSRPESVEGAASVLPVPLDVSTAARLVWQHDVLDQNGQVSGSMLPRTQIDNAIVLAGNELPESVLWLTFGDSTGTRVGRRWRSMSTVLSTTGRDLTRSEYLEFYVWSSAVRGQTLVLDLGTVSEDAFYFDASGFTTGTANGKRWGLGELDEEARATDREVWGTDKDQLGLYGQTCSANVEQRYPLGDPNANCARNNGEADSEDLDGNGVGDFSDLAYFRYVIPIDDASPYLVRDTTATGTNFRLFRVPLRTAGRSVNGAGDGNWRFMKHLRMTVTSNSAVPIENFVFARMKITGSRWTKRDVHGIIRGLTGDQPSPSGAADNLQVGPVSRLNDENYSSPIGVGDELQDPSQRFGGGAIEFNEKSLKLDYSGLAPGDRAEVYYRYPQQSRGLLSYRQLRLWGLARRGNWGPTGDMRLLIKVGNDPRNYYLYQTKLTAPVSGVVDPNQWLPEIVMEFEQWFKLRTRAEQIENTTTRQPGEAIVVWSEDSTYAAVLQDRARGPNLAALRELTFAVYNAGSSAANGEVWIDDLRLTASFKDPGFAGNISMDVRGGDFLSANLTYSDQSAVFRQLNQDARYQRAGELSVTTTAQLGQFLPGGWGVDAPLTVVHARSAQDPTFLEGTDIRAIGLPNLRDTGSDATRVALTLRKRTPSSNPWLGLIVDGLQLRAGYNTADNSSITTRAEANGVDGGVVYGRELTPRTVDILPGFMDAILRALTPATVERSNFFTRLTGSRLRWSPERISFGSQYYRQDRRSFQFNRILELAEDSTARPIESPRHGLENDAQITFAPFQALRASFTARSSRDLLDAERASTRPLEQTAIERARAKLGGVDIGWESTRQFGTEFNYRPDVAPWLRPNVNYSARYGTDRNPSYLDVQFDSTGLMQRRFQSDRQFTRGFSLEPAGLLGGLFNLPVQGTDTLLAARGPLTRWVFKTGRALQPLELNWNSSLGSQFERELNTPGLAYQFGWGGFDDFRLIGGDTAVFVHARDAFVARSGVRLPLNLLLGTSYEQTTLDAIDQRGGQRTESERRWPNVQLNWTAIRIPKFVSGVITSANLTMSHEQARQRSLLGSIGAQNRGGQERRNNASLSLVLPYRFTAAYAANLIDGTSTDPTGDAEHGSNRHTVTLGGSFHPPESMRTKLKAPIVIALAFDQQSQHQCRFRPTIGGTTEGTEDCVPFIDFRNRRLNLRFDTQITDMTVGFDMTYTARQSFVGTRNGTSQFQLGFFGRFNMTAGRALEGSGLR